MKVASFVSSEMCKYYVCKIACVCAIIFALCRGGSRGGGGGGALGAEAPPFIFRLYLINMLSIIMKFCLSIII